MANSMVSLEDAWKKHNNCNIVIYYNQFSNGQLVPGLYCEKYGTWIQWLKHSTANQLLASGVKQTIVKPKRRNGHPVTWASKEELGI